VLPLPAGSLAVKVDLASLGSWAPRGPAPGQPPGPAAGPQAVMAIADLLADPARGATVSFRSQDMAAPVGSISCRGP